MPDLPTLDLLQTAWRAAVAEADPRRATRDAVAGIDDLAASSWVIAAGKGGHAMAAGAVEALAARGLQVAGGVVVAHTQGGDARHGLEVALGDHPVPQRGSLAAADRIGAAASGVPPGDDAIVLMSGGATSLMAGPVPDVAFEEVQALFTRLLASGAGIELMNAIRKRVLRWGAGRLAVALQARRVHCLIASDVVGNDPAFIASGPCVPDPLTASELISRLDAAGLVAALPPGIRSHIADVAAGRATETPKASHPRFTTTSSSVILDRHTAVRGAVASLAGAGVAALVQEAPLVGEAAAVGEQVARRVLDARAGTSRPACLVSSGEPTVRLGADHGVGGRCQELALAAAGVLRHAGAAAAGITILAAGTDGRDGPTDAAGAIVDAGTWDAIARAGVDPSLALARHDAHTALAAAGALFRTGPTGTNVNDLVLALVP